MGRQRHLLFFRKRAGGRFEDAPYWRIDGPAAGLDHPHDLAFSRNGNDELLAVGQRRGAITLYKKNRDGETYGPEPILEISGQDSKLFFTDGVAFVPPDDAYLAASNLFAGTISFYRRLSRSPLRFEGTPEFELTHESVYHPDGLAFSSYGRWLATTNHGAHTVSVFRRRNRILSGGKLRYGPESVTIIKDPLLRYPHSAAFTPQTNHLIVTNAGANYFSVYEPKRDYFGMRWSQSPLLRKIVGSEETFRKVNRENEMEGGPKGVAIHNRSLAVCNPEFGIEIHSFRETSRA